MTEPNKTPPLPNPPGVRVSKELQEQKPRSALASTLIGGLLLVLIVVLLFADLEMDRIRFRLLGIVVALCTAFLAYFLTGTIGVDVAADGEVVKKPVRGTLRAAGGLAVFAVVLMLWWFVNPVDVSIAPQPSRPALPRELVLKIQFANVEADLEFTNKFVDPETKKIRSYDWSQGVTAFRYVGDRGVKDGIPFAALPEAGQENALQGGNGWRLRQGANASGHFLVYLTQLKELSELKFTVRTQGKYTLELKEAIDPTIWGVKEGDGSAVRPDPHTVSLAK